jgi:metal-responsive CopG/Arc/MetJ family transcriptional regulator
MKVKTSITLSEKLLFEIDRAVGEGGSRSAFIERVVDWYLAQRRMAERDAHDAAIYAAMAERGELESDVLDYSIDPFELGDDVEVLIDEERAREAG